MKHRKLLAAAIISGLILLLILLNGLPLYTSTATCQETRHTCHGIPLGQQCIGVERQNTEILDKNRCKKVEEIQQRCNTAGKELCKVNEGIGTEWAKKAEVEGQTCQTWKQKYSLNLTKC